MAKRKNTYPKTFRPLLIERFGAFLAFGIALVLFVAIFADYLYHFQFSFDVQTLISGIFAVLMFHFMVSIMWFLAELTFHFAITVTQDGIWFHGYGKRFYTWDAMTDLGKHRNGWSSQSVWGIKARKPQIVYRNVIGKWLLGNWSYNSFIPLNSIVFIPKKWLFFRDMEAFKNTEFGQELFYFAPYLFDEAGQEKRKNRLYDADEIDDYVIVSSEDYQELDDE